MTKTIGALLLLSLVACADADDDASTGKASGAVNGQAETQGEKGEKGADGAAGANGADGADGLDGEKGETGAQGEKGATGAQGAQGAQGEQGESGVVETQQIGGFINPIAPSKDFVWAGPTTFVTVKQGQRITGMASAILGIGGAAPATTAGVDLCFQVWKVGYPVENFHGSKYLEPRITAEPQSVSAAGSVQMLAPGESTVKVGFCVRNANKDSVMNPFPIANNDMVNAVFMVTN